MPPPRDAVSALLEQSRAMIRDHGFMVTGVFPTAERPGTEFAYTAGLTAVGAPELLIVGLPVQPSYELLAALARRVLDGTRWLNGHVLADLLADDYHAVVVDGTAPAGMPLSVANQLYGHGRVRVQQVVWPDDNGFHPWDALWSCDAPQPTIGRPPTGGAAT